MRKSLFFILFLTAFYESSLAWEPVQAQARKVSIEYKLFKPYGLTTIEVKVDEDGYIDVLKISTENKVISIPAKKLKQFKNPSLPDIEVMHYGEFDKESGLGGTFSLCIPYGYLERVENEEYWQRSVLGVFVGLGGEKIIDIPLPKNGNFTLAPNDCEIAGQELYGI